MSAPLFNTPDEARVLTVSELTALIKGKLESAFPDICVMGEVSGLKKAASGHVYLTLKDKDAVVRAVMWRNTASGLRFDVRDGLQVVARGNIDVYPPRGSYQLIITWLMPQGQGDLQLAYQQLLHKLEEEGLFRPEHKKPLPPYPTRIGVVTSPTGAAVRDIVNVISRRFPPAEIVLYPCRVQGAEAAGEIVQGIQTLNRHHPEPDVIIIGRGGGSLEDLWAFNEEAVARAVFASRIPIVSAVGHEVDFTISDFVADVRAATPTEAGEIVVPDRRDVLHRLIQYQKRLALALERRASRERQRVEALASRYVFRRPDSLLHDRAQRADDAIGRLRAGAEHRMGLLCEQLVGAGRRLEALSPLKVLERGYSVTFGPDGQTLRSVEALSAGDTITTRLHQGTLRSALTDITPDEPDAEAH